MQGWITTCIAFSLCGGFFKLILEAAGSERAVKALQTTLSILMLSLAIGALCKEELPTVTISDVDKCEYYQQLQEETFADVLASAEKELGATLCAELKTKFGKVPLACAVSVDRETLALSAIKIYYKTDSIIISTYEIKNYIYTTYGIQAEVIFE